MTNNDEIALKLNGLARKAKFGHFDLQEFLTEANPANILALLAERDADKKLIADLEQKADIYDMLRTDYEIKGSLVDFVDYQTKRVTELESICVESYQVVGALVDAAGVFETSEAVSKALDNLSEAKLVHEDVLPFAVEARTVSVKLLDCDFAAVQHMSGGSTDYCNGFIDGTQNAIKCFKADLAAAGINLDVGE